VQYFESFIALLLANDVEPVVVFDGQMLPGKANVEKKRKE
jgi:hypothetical protein